MRYAFPFELAKRWPVPDVTVIATSDRAQAEEWYETVLGMRRESSAEPLAPDGRSFSVPFASDFQHVLLSQMRAEAAFGAATDFSVPLCLIVPSPGEALRRQMERQTVSFGDLPHDPVAEGSNGLVRDPDGNVWRIVSPGAASVGESFGASIWWHKEFWTGNVVLSHNDQHSDVRLRRFLGQNLGLCQTERGACCSLDRKMAIQPGLASRLLEALHTMRTTSVESADSSMVLNGLSISGWQWREMGAPSHFSWFSPRGQVAEEFCSQMQSVIDDVERSQNGSRVIGKNGLFARLWEWAEGTFH